MTAICNFLTLMVLIDIIHKVGNGSMKEFRRVHLQYD